MAVDELQVGEWIATVKGEIVARAESERDVTRLALREGYALADLLVEKIVEPGIYVL